MLSKNFAFHSIHSTDDSDLTCFSSFLFHTESLALKVFYFLQAQVELQSITFPLYDHFLFPLLHANNYSFTYTTMKWEKFNVR